MTPRITDIRFRRAGHRDLATGLLGWVSFVLDDRIRIDGVTVRETRDGRRVLSFPARKAGGEEHPYVRPINTEVREAIERQVLDEIGVQAWGMP